MPHMPFPKRRLIWLILSLLVIVGITSTMVWFPGTSSLKAHAAAKATISISPSSVRPGQPISVTGRGFAPNNTGTLLFANGLAQAPFACDAKGHCAGTLNTPIGLVGGPYIISAYDGFGSAAQAVVTVVPLFHSSPARGSVGAFIQLSGDGLVAGETLTFYWGKPSTGINEGAAIVSANGTFQDLLIAPLQVAPGHYQISAVESSHPKRVLHSWFEVLAARISGPGGFHNGNPVTVHLSYFEPGEGVNIRWNANGGQLLAGAGMDNTGAGTATFTPPSAVKGTYTLSATGLNSGVVATTSLSIGPGITASPITAVPGSTITVTGGGFAAKENLHVYFQMPSNGVTQVSTDAQGNFTTPLILPGKYQPGTSYAIHAVAVVGTDRASVPFTFTTPFVGANAFNTVFGIQEIVDATGFAVGEPINFYWNYGQTGQLLVQTFTADSQGSVYQYFTVPSDPNLNPVMYGAVGVQSGLIATGSIQEDGAMVLTPNIANPGQTVQIQVGGLASGENATVVLNSTTIATGTTDASGLLTTTFVVTPSTQYDSIQLSATGSTSGLVFYGQLYYNELLTITPTTGSAGTVVTLNGSQYVPGSMLQIVLYDSICGCPGTYGSVTVGIDGTFTATLTIPSGLVSGELYLIWVGDPSMYPPDGIAIFTYQ
jgi:hypothetical protein